MMNNFDFQLRGDKRKRSGRKRQLTAILLSVVLMASSCMPMSGMTAFAAENAAEENAAGESTEQAAEEEVSLNKEDVNEEKTVEPQEEPLSNDLIVGDQEEAGDAQMTEQENTNIASDETSDSGSAESKTQGENTNETHEESVEERISGDQAIDITVEGVEEEIGKAALNSQESTIFSDTEDISEGETKQAVVSMESPYAVWKFTPSETGEYYFCSLGDEDTYGEIYDAEYNLVTSDDDSGNNRNFKLSCQYLEEGCDYYLAARLYDTNGSASFTVCLAQKLYVDSYDPDVYVSPGESVTLSVSAHSSNGEISYEWERVTDDEYENIGNSDHVILTPTKREKICCHISDGIFNEDNYFNIYLDNHLVVKPEGAENEDDNGVSLYIAPGSGPLTLRTIVSADDESQLHYQWQVEYGDGPAAQMDEIDGANAQEYTVETPINGYRYYCYVSDQYGNHDSAYFYIYIENHFKVWPEGKDYYEGDEAFKYIVVEPNQEVTLRVMMEADDTSKVTFQWFKDNDDGWMEELEGESGDNLSVTATKNDKYTCRVSDGYGASVDVAFYITVDNELRVSASQLTDQYAATILAVPGEDTITLQAYATARDMTQLSYKWERFESVYNEDMGYWYDEYYPVPGTSDIITISASELKNGHGRYSCTVSDQYGNSEDCVFDVFIDNKLTAYPEGGSLHNQLVSLKLPYGENYTLAIHADAIDKSQLSYAWYKTNAEDGNRELIEGENGPELIICAEEAATYDCVVEDQYGSIVGYYVPDGPSEGGAKMGFEISIDNRLNVYPSGNDPAINIRKIKASAGEELTLTTVVTAEDMSGMQYSWSSEDEIIDDAGSATLTVNGEDKVYCCTASDRFGNAAQAYFVLYTAEDAPVFKTKKDSVNVYPEGAEIIDGHRASAVHLFPAFGEEVSLKVVAEGASASDIQYEWQQRQSDYGAGGYLFHYNRINGADSDTYTVTVTGSTVYRCVVSISGTEKTLYFYIHNSSFSVYPEGAEESDGVHNNYARIIAGNGDDLTLRVVSEQENTNLTYQWCYLSYLESGSNSCSSTDSYLQVKATPHTYYKCLVSDQNNNEEIVYFFIDENNFQLSSQNGEFIPDPEEETHERTATDSFMRVVAKYGEKVTLKTTASAYESEGIRFSWYYSDDIERIWDRDELERFQNMDSIDIEADHNAVYFCEAYDAHHNRKGIFFYIIVDNELTAYPAGAGEEEDGSKKQEITINLEPSETCVLETKVNAINQNGITYEWFDEQGGYVTTINTEKIPVTAEKNTEYRCVVKDILGNESTATFKLNVTSDPGGNTSGDPSISGDPHGHISGDPIWDTVSIGSHPQDVEAKAGEQVTFYVGVSAAEPTFQWQWSKDGVTWKNSTAAGCNTDTFSFTMSAKYAGRLYRCVVSNGINTAYSRGALLSLKVPVEIISDPEDVSVKAGEQATFTVAASGENLSYQWQWSKDGVTWKNSTAAGYNTDTFSFTMNAKYAGRQYRCMVTNGNETVYSNGGQLSLKVPINIISDPEDVSAEDGEQATFTVVAEGENLSYQWQWSKDGVTWKNSTAAGYNTDTFSFKMNAKYAGRQYRCMITDGTETAYTEGGLLSLKVPINIISEPDDVRAKEGNQAAFTVEAEGENLSYQWQWSKDGVTWKNSTAAGYNTDTFSFKMSAKYAGRLYRCMITNGTDTAYTRGALLSVAGAIEIVSEPEDVSVRAGEQATFAVVAEGENLSYQWQWSKDGVTWKNSTAAGYNTDTFSFTMNAKYAGRLYRCMITDGTESSYTRGALLSVSK